MILITFLCYFFLLSTLTSTFTRISTSLIQHVNFQFYAPILYAFLLLVILYLWLFQILLKTSYIFPYLIIPHLKHSPSVLVHFHNNYSWLSVLKIKIIKRTKYLPWPDNVTYGFIQLTLLILCIRKHYVYVWTCQCKKLLV